MAEKKIEFRKIRDFGENLSDTFLFVKLNFKTLLVTLLAICGVFMLALAIFNGVYQSRFFGIFDQVRRGLTNNQYRNFDTIFTPEYFLTILFTWLTHIAMQVTLAAYIKQYVALGNIAPKIEQVWEVFKRNYLKVLLCSIPVYIMTLIGFVFCLVPGIFLAVVFVPFSMILVIEDADFGYSFNRCFEIIKDNFWISLGIYIVAGMIYYFSISIVGVIVGLVVGIFAFLSTNSVGTTIGILTSVLNILTGTLYLIFFVSASLNYFSLVESRDGTGIKQRIDNLGSSEDHFDNTEKQY